MCKCDVAYSPSGLDAEARKARSALKRGATPRKNGGGMSNSSEPDAAVQGAPRLPAGGDGVTCADTSGSALGETMGEGDGVAGALKRRRPRRDDGGVRDQRLPEIRVTAAEREAIEAGAARVQMSMASYLRSLGLGHNPPSKVDLRAIHELGRLRADLGRLGGLLKLWLTDRAGEGTEARDVARVLAEIEAKAAEVESAVRRL